MNDFLGRGVGMDALVSRIVKGVVAGLTNPVQESLVDSNRAAKFLGCSKATIERWTRNGTIPSYKIGSKRLYRLSELLPINKDSGVA
jgi:excisionase family DNA binding protein